LYFEKLFFKQGGKRKNVLQLSVLKIAGKMVGKMTIFSTCERFLENVSRSYLTYIKCLLAPYYQRFKILRNCTSPNFAGQIVKIQIKSDEPMLSKGVRYDEVFL